MAKYLSELSREELELVFNKNAKLQEKVSDDYQESQMFWIGEYLHHFKRCLNDWNIGFYNRNSLDFKDDNELFISCLEELQKGFAFLEDKYNEKIEEVKQLIDKVDEMEREIDDVDEENYKECEKIIEELKEEVEDKIKYLQNKVLEQFNKETDYSSEDIEDYFFEFYKDERMDDGNFYIDDEFVLFENVSYTKSYK